jgi:hypothetical protein
MLLDRYETTNTRVVLDVLARLIAERVKLGDKGFIT